MAPPRSKKEKPPVDGRGSTKPVPQPGRGRLSRLVGFAAKWMVIAAIWGSVGLAVLLGYHAYDLPSVDKALLAQRRPAVTLLARDGSILASFGDTQGAAVRLGDLPVHLEQAVLATEDRRFRSHWGMDVIGLARAMMANLKAGRIVQGGSTITQQVAKNLFLSPSRTVRRKLRELLLALWLEHKFSKDQILTIYLNRVYLGAGTYGVEAAARKFFSRPAARLNLYQSALIAGLLKAPSRLNPQHDARAADRRARVVLANMVAAGFITPARAGRAGKGKARRAARPSRGAREGRYFADWIIEQLPGFVGPQAGDVSVLTTLDKRLQRIAQKKITRLMGGGAARVGATQLAFVALSPDGAVRAMVGGRDHAKSQFNRATQALRQPGSAFKPFVYLAALEAGLSPESRLIDGPVSIGDWQPRNYAGTYEGEVSLSHALAGSINTVAVKLAERTGRERVIGAARRLGLTTRLKATPSLALGTGEVTLIELVSAYGVLANGGTGVWAHGISEIRDRAGRLIYRRAGDGPGRVVEPRQVAAMNAMLSQVIEQGTGRAARLDRPAAGKTGTSQDFRDAWFIGYTADLVAGVWLGNDDGRPMKKVTGGGLPAHLWRDVMTGAHDGLPKRPLPGLAPRPESLWQSIVRRLGG